MSAMSAMHIFLVMCAISFGILSTVDSRSVNEPLFTRGCRANRGQFPHETYCQQYYNCWDGRATIEECPGKLLFNPVISACDYPEAVNCGPRLRNPEPAVTADGRCLKQFGVFPDIRDCTAFYKCSHGRAYRQICPYYTAFDERYLVCVHAYEVDCGGRGGIYGTLAPPNFHIPDGGTARIDSGPSRPGSASGWDSKPSGVGSGSVSIDSQVTLSPGSSSGTGGRKVGSDGTQGVGSSGPSTGIHGTGTRGSGDTSNGVSGGTGTSSGAASGGAGGGSGRGDVSGSGVAGAGAGRQGSGGSSGSGRESSGSVIGGRTRGPSGTNDGITGTRGGTGTSGGGQAGITGIVDKDISATGQERQYERPISPEATFRCPHPRGLYANALDCTEFWLCREYKPSLLKCPAGQLFDLASLSCTDSEKAKCASISPRT